MEDSAAAREQDLGNTMKSYCEREIFSERELRILAMAKDLVSKAPYEILGEVVRCHELARAIGGLLHLEFEDGWYGMLSHSWLWTTTREELSPPPNILDVYVPGRLPQVQLVHSTVKLPYEYRRGDLRKDIRPEAVLALQDRFIRGTGPED